MFLKEYLFFLKDIKYLISKNRQIVDFKQNTSMTCHKFYRKQKSVYFLLFFSSIIIFTFFQQIKVYNKSSTHFKMTRSSYFFLFFFIIIKMYCLNPIQLIGPNDSVYMYFANDTYNSQFVSQATTFNCSLTNLYTYGQNSEQNQANQPYQIVFQNVNSFPTFQLQAVYDVFNPSYSLQSCTTNCVITVLNNCDKDIGFFNKFNMITLTVDGYSTPFQYNVLCDTSSPSNTFQWGLFILIIFCTILLVSIAIYSKAWSIGGNGIRIRIWMILVFDAAFIIGGIIAYFSQEAVSVIIQILCIIYGLITIWICSNQVIFLFKVRLLQKPIFKFGSLLQVRILDFLSVLVSLGIIVGWVFSGKNWIVNDIVCVCMIVASIKIFKFTQLSTAIACFILTLAVQMTFVFFIHFAVGTSFNLLVLNSFNFPFQLQMPTINPVYQQKCSWLAFTGIIYPGILMSYFRRFDTSRNTNIYLITSTIIFISGSFIWMFISIFSKHAWPFSTISGPLMLGLVCLFAYKRRQIRTLWQGKFYDEEFADQDGIQMIKDTIKQQRRQTQLTFTKSLIQGLRMSEVGSSRTSELPNEGFKDDI